MNKTYAVSTRKLVIPSGPGLESCNLEVGNFEVKWGENTKQFENIIGAVKFYCKLEEEASIWNLAELPVLIESKIVIPVNCKI